MMISSISHTSEPHYALFLEIIWLITIHHNRWNDKFWSWPYLVFRANITFKFYIFKTNYTSCVIYSVPTFGTLCWFWIFSQVIQQILFIRHVSWIFLSIIGIFFFYYTGQGSCHHKSRLFSKTPTGLSLCDRFCPWSQFFILFLESQLYYNTLCHVTLWYY